MRDFEETAFRCLKEVLCCRGEDLEERQKWIIAHWISTEVSNAVEKERRACAALAEIRARGNQ